MNSELFREIDVFVNSTTEVVYLRHDDSILFIRPDKIQHLDRTGFEMLHSLYKNGAGAEKTVEMIHEKYGTKRDIIVRDLSEIVKSLDAVMHGDKINDTIIPAVYTNTAIKKYPSHSEIALTCRCQNRCDFCSSSHPLPGKEFKEMTAAQVKLIIDKIYKDVKVTSISFTGGEPTLRKDLPELIEYASSRGMRTNLVTNGIKCHDKSLVKNLIASGLNSARVSLESHDDLIHNRITGNIESHKNTVQGIHNLIEAGIQTHTITTLCRENSGYLIPLIKFVKNEFNIDRLSMKMSNSSWPDEDNKNLNIGYSSITAILEPVIKYCDETGIKLTWNSPVPYCMFNPVSHNLASKSCTCASSLLSINPAGEVIPCSSYSRVIGNILNTSFKQIWNSDEALYFREKKYIPPVCQKCSMKILCKGGCPLHWENAGSFREIEAANRRRPLLGSIFWSIGNRLKIKAKRPLNPPVGDFKDNVDK